MAYSDSPISLSDVYRLEEAMKNVRTLADMGMASCTVVIRRWTGGGSIVVFCKKPGGHLGEHETE